MTGAFDVAIVGAGDVGTAIARELARFELRVVLLEAGRDVGAGTSKANTAILHTGFDATPGTVEATLVARGHDLLERYAAEVGIPLERTGALLVAWTPEQLGRFDAIRDRAAANGYSAIRFVDVDELRRREPHLGPGALGALEVPGEHVVCPWTPPLACATQAVLAGVELRRDTEVTALQRDGDAWTVTTSATADGAAPSAAAARVGPSPSAAATRAGLSPSASATRVGPSPPAAATRVGPSPSPSARRGRLRARWVINAAGLGSDRVHRMAGLDGFTIVPRRGELVVFDKLARPLVSHVLLPVPTATTKGVLIAPTVFGNVMLGPTADDVPDATATQSTGDGLDRLRAAGERLMPALLGHEVTAIYAGLRAATEHKDYVLETHAERGYVATAGIRSTGLTAALAIAEWVRDELDAAGLPLRERPEGLPEVTMPNLGEAFPRPYAQADRIAADPAYGEVVCFCERVTRGEIRDAARAPIPPADLDGLRRRTRTLMGRCQGFYCGAHVARELEAAGGPPATQLWETPK